MRRLLANCKHWTRTSILKWPFGQAFDTTLFAVIFSVLNTRKSPGFGVTQGFPFVYIATNDGPPSIDFYSMPLVLNVLVGAFTAAVIWKFGPKHNVRCRGLECLLLGVIAAGFTWANIEVWYGWRPTLLSISASESPSAGFPFAYWKEGNEIPQLLGLNFLILFVTLASISQLFHRRRTDQPADLVRPRALSR
jgi:hypothetical protein